MVGGKPAERIGGELLMADYLTTDTELTSVANAIRTKGGTSAALTYPTGFVSAIEAISAGTDVSDTTAAAGDVLSGKYFYTSSAVKTQGTIATKTSSDLTASGDTVTVPAGYYASQANKAVSAGTAGTPTATKGTVSSHSISVTPSVTNSAGYISSGTITGTAVSVSASELVSGTKTISASGTTDVTNYASASVAAGSAATPATTVTANPSISVDSSTGVITATASATKSVTPTVSAGYVSSGTAGTITVSGSNTSSLTTQAAQTIHPSTTDQTVASGKYLTGAQTFKAVALTNLTAGNIKSGVTVKVGDSTDDDCVASVTGTYDGGGGGTVTESDVNFYDYDGTLVASKTKAQINAMTADSDLPANPSHTGLTAQGWNWTVAQLKAQLTAMPNQKVNVGQMYVTASGATEIDVEMKAGRLSPILAIYVNGTVTVDWGDNTTTSTVTGTSLTTRKDADHTYASAGSYTIKISATTNTTYSFTGGSSYPLLRKNSTGNENKVYANCIKNIRLGTGVKDLSSYAFINCYSLRSITIPNTVDINGPYVFQYCYSLLSVTVPKNVTSVQNYTFHSCCSLKNVSIPSTVTSIGTYAFYYCYALENITIPSGVTSIGDNALYNCYSLESITIPSGVTSIGSSTFYNCYSLQNIDISSEATSIGNNAFLGCASITSITIPSKVTSIGTSAFSAGYGIAEYHFKPTSPPTLTNTNTFSNIVSDCKFYVPTASLSTYQSASIWSNYASRMVGE